MASHGWGRTQKYRARPRHLYALLFQNGACYVGQTVNLKTRMAQHRQPSGGWMGAQFELVHLGQANGTQLHAEDHEYAWRYKAQNAGWIVYAKPPSIVIDATRRMTLKRRLLALGMRWPRMHRRTLGGWPWAAGILAVAALMILAR